MGLKIRLLLIKQWNILKPGCNRLQIKAAIPPNLGFRDRSLRILGYAMIILEYLSKEGIIGKKRQIMV